jgi:hypothetical protein
VVNRLRAAASSSRRYHAIVYLGVIRRRARLSGVPVTVAIDWDALRTALGAATLDYGQLINAATARRLACDGKLIPAVLGGDSEPLDVGRAMPDPPTQPRPCARPSGPCSVAPGQRGRRCLLVAGQWRHHACRGRTTGSRLRSTGSLC